MPVALPMMNAAGYRCAHFLRVGIPLLVLLWLSPSFVLLWSCHL